MHWRQIGDKETARYDDFIARAQHGHIMQSYSWGDVKTDWRPKRFVAEDANGEILAAALLLFRRLPLFGRTIAYAPRGPVLSDYEKGDLLLFTLQSLAGEAAAENAILLKIDPAVPDGHQPLLASLSFLGFKPARDSNEFGGLQARYTFRLDLQAPIQDIFSRFSKKVRYKITYAPKKGLVFRFGDQTSIDDLTYVLNRTSQRSDFVTRAPEYFHHLYSILKKDDRVLLATGYIAEEPVVSSLTFLFGETAWAVYGGQADSYRNLYTYHALNWERIRWAHSRGARWFDFYGVPGQIDESHPLYGLYHFKASFGGEYTAYVGEWDLPLSKPLYMLWETGIPAYQSVVRRALKIIRK